MKLVNEVLDTQLVDSAGRKSGKVDGIVLQVDEQGRAHVVAIEIGSVVRARRIGRCWGRFALRLNRLLGVCRDPHYRIPWSSVKKVGLDIEVHADLAGEPPLDWERWLRERIVSKVPFS